jgi:hypothetical protein
MSVSFVYLLGNFAWGAHCIALALGGVACLRLWKRGADKTFAVSAWLALVGVALLCLPWMAGWVMAYLQIAPAWWMLTSHAATISAILLFGHFLLCAVGAFRTANRLPSRPRDPVGSAEAAE